MRSKHHRWDQPTLQSFDDYQLYIGTERTNHFGGSGADMTIALGRAGNDHLRGGAMDDDLIGGRGNVLMDMSIMIGPGMITGISSSSTGTTSTTTAGWIDALAVLNSQQMLAIMDSLRSARNLLS